MTSYHDPSKKTSITSLLNPPTADADTPYQHSPSPYISPQPAVHHRHSLPQGHHTIQYTSASAQYHPQNVEGSYRLQAVDWSRNTVDGGQGSGRASSVYLSPQKTSSGYQSSERTMKPLAPRPPPSSSGMAYGTEQRAPPPPPPHQYQHWPRSSEGIASASGAYAPHSPSEPHSAPSNGFVSHHRSASGDHSPGRGPSMNRDRVAGMESAHVWPRSPELPANTSSSFSPRKPAESHSALTNGLASQSQSSSDSATMQSEDPKLTSSQSKPCSPTPLPHRGTDGYQSSGNGQPTITEWQASERASIPLAARGLASPVPPAPPPPPSYYVGAAEASYPYSASHADTGLGQSSTASKRQLPADEAYAAAPKAKRPAKAKAKADRDSAPAPSKRGFNAKKRSEAAQIAAQNAQLTATRSIGDKGKEKTTGSPSPSSEEGPKPVLPNGMVKEVQFARCMSNRYRKEEFPRCVSCTRRWAGDTCRFQGIRSFIKNSKNEILGVMFNSAKPNQATPLQFPNTWNVPLKQEHIERSKKVIAKALISTMRLERAHLNQLDLIRRARETDVRVTCDTCMTSIFSSSWMCRQCGREACVDCFAQIRELTEDRPDATPEQRLEMQKKREKHAHSNPFFLACNKRNEHPSSSFSPMSRFFKEELDTAFAEMERIVEEEDERLKKERRDKAQRNVAAAVGQPSNGSVVAVEVDPERFVDTSGAINWSEVFKAKGIKREVYPRCLLPSGTAGDPYVPSVLPEAVTIAPYYRICRYSDNELTAIESADKFAKIWAYGEPIVVANILSKFKIDWTPEYFIREFGDRECLITECEQDSNKKTTIKDFFGQFGNYTDRKEVWKLKDWPPSADFKTAFPRLYKDFSEAVPVPDYVRRDGVYNIGSHFPSNVIAPDLGPKMYNAWAANQNPGSKGSTRLHMDMADALNVMLYSAPCPDGSPGCAVWDIYRAEDAQKIRAFLRNRHSLPATFDPIHVQQYYLDDLLRAQLWKEHGVCSFRVYQRPGEAIFIPAGCAHQVSNMSDSIKIAIDYVSPENVDRCAQLTKEFREQNKSKVWKEDILQLKAMMWFAWLSCCRQEEKLKGEAGGSQSGESGSVSPSASSSKPRSSGSPMNQA